MPVDKHKSSINYRVSPICLTWITWIIGVIYNKYIVWHT